jgi:hypothetical protein
MNGATISDRVRAVNPLLAAEQSTDHGPTRALLDALRENGWGVKWRQGGSALLVHPDHGTLEIELDESDLDRAVPFVDGRQVSYAYATRRAVGEA